MPKTKKEGDVAKKLKASTTNKTKTKKRKTTEPEITIPLLMVSDNPITGALTTWTVFQKFRGTGMLMCGSCGKKRARIWPYFYDCNGKPAGSYCICSVCANGPVTSLRNFMDKTACITKIERFPDFGKLKQTKKK